MGEELNYMRSKLLSAKTKKHYNDTNIGHRQGTPKSFPSPFTRRGLYFCDYWNEGPIFLGYNTEFQTFWHSDQTTSLSVTVLTEWGTAAWSAAIKLTKMRYTGTFFYALPMNCQVNDRNKTISPGPINPTY